MLTAALLQQRLTAWSAKLASQVPSPDLPAILVYQALFALVHDLKASVQLSEDAAIRNFTPIVLECDGWLRRLAYGEAELPADRFKGLYALATSLEQLPPLHTLLRQVMRASVPPRSIEPAVLGLALGWEGLSRARARAAARAGYTFLAQETERELTALTQYDEELEKRLRGCGGFSIVRQVLPRAAEGSLVLSIHQLVAIPAQAEVSALGDTGESWSAPA